MSTTKDEWTEVSIPLKDFIPTALGRRVESNGPVEPSQINALGFMLSDKKPGKFQMQFEWVKVLRAGQEGSGDSHESAHAPAAGKRGEGQDANE